MRFVAPSQLAVTVGSQVLTAPQSERVLLGSKAEWVALLSGRDKAKAAAPEHQGVWVDWARGALYTLDGCHVLRVLVLDASSEPELPHDGQAENYLDAATLIVACKAAGAKDSVALVRVGTSVLAASLKLGAAGRYTGPAAVIDRLPVGNVTMALRAIEDTADELSLDIGEWLEAQSAPVDDGPLGVDGRLKMSPSLAYIRKLHALLASGDHVTKRASNGETP